MKSVTDVTNRPDSPSPTDRGRSWQTVALEVTRTMKLQQLYTVDEVGQVFGLARNEVLPAIWTGELRVSACGPAGWEVSPGDLASWVHDRNGRGGRGCVLTGGRLPPMGDQQLLDELFVQFRWEV